MLRSLMLTMILIAMTAGAGCSWFRAGDQESELSEEPMAVEVATVEPMDQGGTLPPPPDNPPEGPRPGDLVPLPQMKVIYFDYDRYNIRPDQLDRVEHNLQFLRDNPNIKVFVTGHCDERGTIEYNFNLGMKRARSVRDYLVGHGIAPDRIAPGSKGKEEPVALGHNEQAWAKNRRCEFQRIY